ncbi:hypothetical protein ACGFYV_14810 [Streptomyces sp. NPDC048297]|uniref:hypothetical protein n=1 Tax=Streptomyces sp. NPDC048297 TaxID=3365531 RepID=UPI003723B1C8
MTTGNRRTAAAPDVLRDPLRNHGTAFTQTERDALGLTGRLPAAVLTLEQQAQRAYRQLRAQDGTLAKNLYLSQLHDHNETLYFKVLRDHLPELLPIVHDPTVGEAIQHQCHDYGAAEEVRYDIERLTDRYGLPRLRTPGHDGRDVGAT